MIELHRYRIDPVADEIKQKLDTMIVAYRSEYYDDNNRLVMKPLPFLLESGTVIHGEEEIAEYLVELEKELEWQRSLSGDGCFIDPDSGEIC